MEPMIVHHSYLSLGQDSVISFLFNVFSGNDGYLSYEDSFYLSCIIFDPLYFDKVKHYRVFIFILIGNRLCFLIAFMKEIHFFSLFSLIQINIELKKYKQLQSCYMG